MIDAYRKLKREKTSTDGFMMLLSGYAASVFRAFESCLRFVVGLEDDDIRLVLKKSNSKFVTYEIPVGNYSI